MNSGDVVLGLLNGLTYGLLAAGLVLVYKSNRFINLAHAQMGTIPALLVGKWVLDDGWNWLVAFLVAIATGVVIALLIQHVFIRRLVRNKASSVRLLLMSLVASQLLLGLAIVPGVGPKTSDGTAYPQPFTSNVSVGGVVLSGSAILTAILVPAIVVVLALFLRYSLTGKQIRAAANNPDAARLSGISVTRVSAITWAIAGGLAAVSAVLAAPSQAGTSPDAIGPYLLMVTLGAAAFGAFVSIPLALGGGVLLGLVGQLVNAQTSNGPDGELAVFVLILLVVMARGKAIGKVFALAGSVVDDLPPLRVPPSLRRSPLVLHHRKVLALGALFLLCIWPQLPYFNSSSHQFELGQILIYAMLGVALTMLVGWGGQVSLGHFALVGIGAYLTARWSSHGISLPALTLLIGLIGAVVMVLVGLPALRVRGLTLGVTTLGFAVIVSDWLFQQPWFATSEPSDLTVQPPRIAAKLGTPSSKEAVYYAALVALILACAVAAALRRSNPGRLILAVRDNERSSAAFGVAPATVKLGILAISGFLAAAAGVYWADIYQSAYPAQFTPDVSLAIVAIPVIGGLGSISGAVLSALLIYSATFFAGSAVQSVFGGANDNNLAFSLFIVSVGQFLVLQYRPNGLAGSVQSWWENYLARRARHAEASRSAAPSDLPLVVTNTHVHFGGVVALDVLDLKVQAGEIVGLIGTNGAGKTTLMNVVSGLIEPTRGSVSLFGNEVIDLAPDFRAAYGLGRSFQDASLFAGLTVTETVQVALAHQHKVGMLSAMLAAPWVRSNERTTRRVAQEIVERFGLSEWADTRTSDLSTGTRRVCDLAAQVAARPKLLLLDEPTGGVAQREAEAFVPLLQRIRDELDCSILIVEHDMSLLMRLCDRIYAMEAGSVIAEGTPEEVRNNPRVVASYLGTSEAAIERSGPAQRPRQPVAAAARNATSRSAGASRGRQAASANPSANRAAKKRTPARRSS